MTATTSGTRSHFEYKVLKRAWATVGRSERSSEGEITLRVRYGQWPAYLICQETFGSLTPARRFSCFSEQRVCSRDFAKIEKCISGGRRADVTFVEF